MSAHDVEDDLDAFMAGMAESDGPLPEEPPAPPEDEAGADRLLARIRRLNRDAAAINGVVESKHAEIAAWKEDRLHGLSRQRAFQETTLEGWMRAQHLRDSRVKTIKLPNGELKIRPARERVVVTDKEAAVAWCRTADALADEERFTRVAYDVAKDPVDDVALRGFPVLVNDEGAPEGYCYVEALMVVDLTFVAPCLFVPVLRALPGIVLLVPVRPSFSYNVKEMSR